MRKKILLAKIELLELKIKLLESRLDELTSINDFTGETVLKPKYSIGVGWEKFKSEPHNTELNNEPLYLLYSPVLDIIDNGRITIREEETFKKPDLKLVT